MVSLSAVQHQSDSKSLGSARGEVKERGQAVQQLMLGANATWRHESATSVRDLEGDKAQEISNRVHRILHPGFYASHMPDKAKNSVKTFVNQILENATIQSSSTVQTPARIEKIIRSITRS